MVGRACGLPEGKGIRPGTYCEPKMTTVGSQDTTGPMTRDELKDLACLGFSADLVMQSFCHTAAYPKPVDVKTHHTLPEFISTRGGVSLRPGDGIIHSWLNRMLLPDTVGTGGDSHTRFPDRHLLPGGLGSGGLCRRDRCDAAGYARIRAGALQGQNCNPASPCVIWCMRFRCMPSRPVC
jgi:aconitate hydratase 2/2-methylisocitrate dehydratase